MTNFLALVALLRSERGGLVPRSEAVSGEVVLAVASAIEVGTCSSAECKCSLALDRGPIRVDGSTGPGVETATSAETTSETTGGRAHTSDVAYDKWGKSGLESKSGEERNFDQYNPSP